MREIQLTDSFHDEILKEYIRECAGKWNTHTLGALRRIIAEHKIGRKWEEEPIHPRDYEGLG